MGRSVDYLNNASKVIYCHIDSEDEYAFEDFFDNVYHELICNFPSFYKCERWDGRETKIFLENNLVEVGISEYCGIISISIRLNEHKDVKKGLAENWINRATPTIEKILANYSETLRKIGTFSNGEGIYEKACAANNWRTIGPNPRRIANVSLLNQLT